MPTRKRGRTHHHHHKRRTRRKKRGFQKARCSPVTASDNLRFTCFTSRGLHRLRDVWNMRHSDLKITSNDPRKIWDSLRKYMRSSCDNEMCWLRQQCIKHGVDRSMLTSFAPLAPNEWKKKPFDWLSSLEIQGVMRQWEKARSDFAFIGPSPINYDEHVLFDECVWEELCKFSLRQYIKRGKTKIGIIFNLDTHRRNGSHWVALFIDTKKGTICYFDSYGEKIPKRITKFIDTVKEQSGALGKKYELCTMKRRHQYSESECGMYCLYFIIELIKGRSWKSFEKRRISDKHMRKLRKIYFN